MGYLTLIGLPLIFVVFAVISCCKWGFLQYSPHHPKQASYDDNLKCLASNVGQPIKGRERYRVRMDIHKLDVQNWLIIDNKYMDEHRIRARLLKRENRKVLQCLPGSYDACLEALQTVVDFLCQRFPCMFEQERNGSAWTIRNKMAGEVFAIGGQHKRLKALEIAARLTMEDLSILMKNADNEYYLAASATLFPVGWTVQERIGWTISQLHTSVPLWHQHVSSSVGKFLEDLTSASPKERSSYFVQVKRLDTGLAESLYRPTTLSQDNPNPTPSDIVIRTERQTFRRLPRTGAIIFTVKTCIKTLDELPIHDLQNLAKEIRSWPNDVGAYRGRDVWGIKVLEFCDKIRQHR